jgi:hypothetical protein
LVEHDLSQLWAYNVQAAVELSKRANLSDEIDEVVEEASAFPSVVPVQAVYIRRDCFVVDYGEDDFVSQLGTSEDSILVPVADYLLRPAFLNEK